MMNNTKHEWQYHDKKPTKGRKLLLLQPDELAYALPLLLRLLPMQENSKRLDWFLPFESKLQLQTHHIALSTQLTVIATSLPTDSALSLDLDAVNLALNNYFSDYGWRMVRKELSQIKKRKKKSHIELSNDLIYRLKTFMSLKQLDSFDQAMDHLLSNEEQNHDIDMIEMG
ncbi:hypothetical protein CXF83_12520 [Shewanella sp. Choline-02u-19]|nr:MULTISPECIES: hypothetical protein [unclassified Shewanella]PKG75329.1 hypothetical protein CXF86_08100 [Shewanella sp. GutCb]PKH57976.1 hypothetical protein CXF84_06750 [Shewanella sp. Bg11-22]PKI27475.1 hypothetical protein CXF83_12520 [Shewanella sp. Choline-02u-19]